MIELFNGIVCSNIIKDDAGNYKWEFSPGRLTGSIILVIIGALIPTITTIKKVKSIG